MPRKPSDLSDAPTQPRQPAVQRRAPAAATAEVATVRRSAVKRAAAPPREPPPRTVLTALGELLSGDERVEVLLGTNLKDSNGDENGGFLIRARGCNYGALVLQDPGLLSRISLKSPLDYQLDLEFLLDGEAAGFATISGGGGTLEDLKGRALLRLSVNVLADAVQAEAEGLALDFRIFGRGPPVPIKDGARTIGWLHPRRRRSGLVGSASMGHELEAHPSTSPRQLAAAAIALALARCIGFENERRLDREADNLFD